MWKVLLQEFFHDLKTQRMRVFLTVSAVVWGTMCVVLLLAFGFGLKARMYEGQRNARDRVVRVWGGETSKAWQGLPEGRNVYLHVEDIRLLRESLPLVGKITPSQGKYVRVRCGDNRTTSFCEGVGTAFGELRHMFPQAGGRFLSDVDILEQRRVVFIGDEIATELFGDTDPIGGTIEVDDSPFTVVGVMEPKVQLGMNEGPDSRRVVMPYTTFSTVFNRDWLRLIHIRPADLRRSQELVRGIRDVLSRKYRFDPEDEYAIRIYDDIELEREVVGKIYLGLNIFFGVIGGLTLIIAGVGVANIMYVVVRERTRELGVRRAVGAKKRHIISMYVGESFLITGGGGVVGVLISLGIIGLVSLAPLDSGVLKYMGHPIFSWPIAVVTVSILVAISLLAGIFPARQAAEVDPVVALHYE
ncbi:MAG: ABC transporter permease [Candidatus Krumholzibacteriota bacterium]|nr:ABC transporter permease [Candidatus Krumholzibacteriota bacterium]